MSLPEIADRVPRNHVFVITQKHREILDHLKKWDREYSPMVRDLCRALGVRYGAAQYNLFELDRRGYVELVRDDDGRIRNIKLLAVP